MKISYRMALITAVTALFFTLLAGISYQVHWLRLLQRTAVSVAFSSMIGYLAGIWLEIHLRSFLAEDTRGKKLNAVSEPARDNKGSFDPFTPNSFEHIDRK